MKKSFKNIFLFLILLSIFLTLALSLINTSYTWDELAYIGFAKGLLDGLPYGHITDNIQEVISRPPLFAVTLYFSYLIFGYTELITNLIIPIISVLGIIAVYFLGKKLYDKDFGLIAAFSLATIPAFIFFSHRVMLENYFALLLILDLLFLWMSFKSNKFAIPLGITLALTGMIRYTGFIIIPILLVALFIFKREWLFNFLKSKWFIFSLIVFLLILIPWFIYNLQTFDSLTGSLKDFAFVLEQNEYTYNRYPFHYFVLWLIPIGLISPFVLYGIYLAWKKREKHILILLTILILNILFLEIRVSSLRYIVFLMPLFILLASFAVYQKQKFLTLFLILAIISSVFGYVILLSFAYPTVSQDIFSPFISFYREIKYDQYLGFKQSAQFLETTPEDSIVLSNDCLYVNYYSERTCYWLEELDEKVSRNKIDYILGRDSEFYADYLAYFNTTKIYNNSYSSVYMVNK